MCTILDYAEDKGRQEGRQEGLQEGLQKGLQEGLQKKSEEVVVNALKAGFPIVSIVQLGFTEDDVKAVAHKNNLPIDL